MMFAKRKRRIWLACATSFARQAQDLIHGEKERKLQKKYRQVKFIGTCAAVCAVLSFVAPLVVGFRFRRVC